MGLLSTSALAAIVAPAAPTRTAAVTDTLHGVTVADPYRWLEAADDPEVKAWSEAQNVRTRGYLDAIPGRAAVQARLLSLIKQTSPYVYALKPQGGLVFGLYNDPNKQQPALVTLNGSADPKSRKVLLDPNIMDGKGSIAIDWFDPSPDGTKVAVSLSLNGSEDGTLHVYDVSTGKEIGQAIPKVQYPTAGGSVAWTSDSKGFWYTRFPGDDTPEADRHFFQQVYFHALGEDWHGDKLVLATKDGLPRTAEVYLDNRYGGQVALASVQKGDGNQWQHFALKPDGSFVQVGTYADDVVAASIGPDGSLYGISHAGAPNGKVLKLAAPYDGGFAKARVIVPESGVSIVSGDRNQSLALTKNHLFVRYIDGGPSTVKAFDLDGGHGRALATPPIASIDEIDPMPNGDVLYGLVTYLRPHAYLRWSAATGASKETGLAIASPVKTSDLEVVRVFAPSKDGTKVPLNIIRRKGIKLDGSSPTLLYGYGGYGVNEEPVFVGTWKRLWFDAGGVYVDTNIRGGGEYGERWHQGGMLTRKQNVFDDFDAAGRWLITHHYTTSAHLALLGGSNGGLLMGATLTQHPALARAVVSQVGIYDMLRVELDPNGEFNTTEFGTVQDADQFKALYAYSPYHRVAKGTRYPAVLMMTGANDGRVNPLHSRKFTAALQAANASSRPILLRTSANAGHGIGSSLDEVVAERTDFLTFLFDQLGMKWSAGGK